ncbi:hypothetical protein B0H17DRAFT_1206207 [Mycena rosella]|uniref:Uncharacterized protein n=1 Tax=Mycena rosella TaxID=1033263 RepID=A0AAD7G9J9_MYCRO|nr:hypothetical protein B0H17DRAFT_1206207 [Mycena rosella]
MSTANSDATESSSSPPIEGAIFRAFEPPSQTTSDWLQTALVTAKALAAGGDCIPFPCVKGVFGGAVILLETVEKVKKNRDELKELCENITEILLVVQGQLSFHGGTATGKFKGLCEQFAR